MRVGSHWSGGWRDVKDSWAGLAVGTCIFFSGRQQQQWRQLQTGSVSLPSLSFPSSSSSSAVLMQRLGVWWGRRRQALIWPACRTWSQRTLLIKEMRRVKHIVSRRSEKCVYYLFQLVARVTWRRVNNTVNLYRTSVLLQFHSLSFQHSSFHLRCFLQFHFISENKRI